MALATISEISNEELTEACADLNGLILALVGERPVLAKILHDTMADACNELLCRAVGKQHLAKARKLTAIPAQGHQ